MSLTHTSLDQPQHEIIRCTRCDAELPPSATFCSQCGERVEKQNGDKSSPKNADITDRYRITSLLQRQPPTQVLLALDTQQQRPVVIHDIDVSSLDNDARAQAVAALQNEYDLLRRERIPAIMPLVDLRYFNTHLYVVAGWPFTLAKIAPTETGTLHHQLTTLHDLLQSGLGLPEQQVAIAWMVRLCHALEQLHRLDIVIGNLTPQTILMSRQDYSGEPLLVGSWLPDLVRTLLTPTLKSNNPSAFCAPEALQQHVEPCSDVYSLGAILYLLLTGITPADAVKRGHRPLPSLRDLDPHSDSALDTVLMQALALANEQRYQTISDFSEALEQFLPHTRSAGPGSLTPAGKNQALLDSVDAADNNNDKQDEPSNMAATADMAGLPDSNEKTVSIIPLQARMARRYLSRIKTGKLGMPEQTTGEAIVEKGSIQQRQPDEELVEEAGSGNAAHPALTSELIVDTPMAPIQTEISNVQSDAEPITQLTSPVVTETSQETTAKSNTEEAPATTSTSQEPEDRNEPDIAQQSTVLIKNDAFLNKLATAQNAAEVAQDMPQPATDENTTSSQRTSSLAHLKGLITHSLPAIPRLGYPKNQSTTDQESAETEEESSLLKRMQRFILGEPQQTTSAAALIETPMRVQPGQEYSIRINVIGRRKLEGNEDNGGLSAFGEDDTIHIEVRSALYKNYAYIVQQADVTIPAAGYVAEVTMPMQPLSSGPNGRRERLHIFFMDEDRNPLYEKPFVIELFISHLVQNGREGHNVLSIPL
ncbi:protein kinase family protein [Dictyobacter arantiisoli]|uniref:non-specific serine/threonine protein kinase n=1 Tax=Dictyobacter arantiisoli TaxID=2014874 RepID=A0A5A5T5N5_9CHLR|nr:protein kinase family protein [Dictyobacter arantiisoli]GCF06648.1 hypothetical protein KDI_02120 [Dictyobacter arantiisoli]